tara:strand:+ start:1034 stop:2143 length:1110 start_codon:yes stop_codon:yes gene_type:complete
MASTIILKNGTAGAPSSLSGGEVAMNRTTGIFYFGDGSNVQELHRFNNISASGHITASGDISASGKLYANLAAGTGANVVILGSGGELVTDAVRQEIFAGIELLTIESETDAPNLTVGSAVNATNATNIVATTNTENEGQFVAFLDNNNSTAQQIRYDAGLKYNPSLNNLNIAGNLAAVTQITASHNVSGSGTGSFTAGVTSNGPIRGKQLQIIAANWKDNAGTTETFIPLAGVPDEQTSGVKEQQAMIMPCSGRVREIILRMHWASNTGTNHVLPVEDITWKIYTRASNKRMNSEGTAVHTFTMVNPKQGADDTNNTRSQTLTGTEGQYNAGDALMISMQWASTGPTDNADRIYVSVVLENDWDTVSY